MLEGALVERYSRQILLPEVGGRGQERLLARRVAVTGDDAAGRFAATMLAAAGVGVDVLPGPPGEVRVSANDAATVIGRWHSGAGIVATLVGRPCPRCVDASALALPPADPLGPAGPAVAQAVGALVAAEALCVLLGLATTGRVHALDFARGAFGGGAMCAAGCSACGAPA